MEMPMAEHCREVMRTKNCLLYITSAMFRGTVGPYGANKSLDWY